MTATTGVFNCYNCIKPQFNEIEPIKKINISKKSCPLEKIFFAVSNIFIFIANIFIFLRNQTFSMFGLLISPSENDDVFPIDPQFQTPSLTNGKLNKPENPSDPWNRPCDPSLLKDLPTQASDPSARPNSQIYNLQTDPNLLDISVELLVETDSFLSSDEEGFLLQDDFSSSFLGSSENEPFNY